MAVRNTRFILSVLAVAALVVGCTGDDPSDEPQGPAGATVVFSPDRHTVLLDAADPAVLALTASQQVFERSPVVVLADVGGAVSTDGAADDGATDDATDDGASDPDVDVAVRSAQADAAEELGAPALVVGGAVSVDRVADELERLGVRVAVVVSPREGAQSPQEPDPSAAQDAAAAASADVVHLQVSSLPGRDEADEGALTPAALQRLHDDVEAALAAGVAATPSTDTQEDPEGTRLREVLALTDPQPGQEAAIATIRAAGAVEHQVPGGDIAGSPEIVADIDRAQALAVIGVGPSFGDAGTFAWRVAAAERGDLLPTGTQHLLPARYVTTSGDRRADPADVVARAAETAEAYAALSDDPVVPTVVVQASAPAGHPGEDGDWVAEEPVAELEPLVDAALEAGQLVLLDVGAGTSTLLEEVEPLAELLQRPGVGVALNPEQRRSDGVRPPQQASVEEVEAVITYIEGVVTNHGLPPAMVVVHQTRPESVVDRERLADVAAGTAAVEIVLAADRTGGPTTGEWVWGRVTEDLPDGVHAGWAGSVTPPANAADLVPTDPAPLLVAGP